MTSIQRRFDHHPPCPGGCNELADECACPNPNPLGSMFITQPIGSAPTTCWRSECRNGCYYPTVCTEVPR